MLPPKWRIQVKNETGFAVDVEIKYRGKKITSGALAYGALWSSDLGTTALANNAFHSTAEIDNESDLFLAADVEVALSNFAGTPAGHVIVYFQARAEASAEWPPNGAGFIVASHNFTATGTQYLTGEV